VALRDVTLRRTGESVDRVKLRYRSRPLAGRIRGAAQPGVHARLELVLEEAVEGAAPGQLACLMQGELVIGSGTITRRLE
jgi:tRNA-specific 2-thiouridylase